ncbi:MAG: glycerophosphodiester phosphodiesterase [Gammaproteobacteria bacterium]|nr:glycerophosphodiester phosphodiesterase [Gammaproteobacteria bacterium]
MKLSRFIPGFLLFATLCTTVITGSLLPISLLADETMTNSKIVIAHRGASGYLPEHTLQAKALAYGMGADFIEQDVVLTRDKIPVVIHDLELDDVSNVKQVFPDRARRDGKYYVIDFDLAELKQLNLHERTRQNGSPRYPARFPPGDSAFKIATLGEEIELIQGLNKSTGKNIGIYTELKSPAWHRDQGYDLSIIVLETLSEYGYNDASDNIYLQCFDHTELQRVRDELNSKLKLVQLIGENSWNEADTDYNELRTREGLEKIATYANGIGPSIDHIVRHRNGDMQITSLVKDAHNLNLAVHPYTLRKDNLPAYVSAFDELLDILFNQAGVDGVFTDFPDLAVKFKNQN